MNKYNQITLLRQDDATVTPDSQQVSSQKGYTAKQLRSMNKIRQNKQMNTPSTKRNYKYVSYDHIQYTLKFIGICENK